MTMKWKKFGRWLEVPCIDNFGTCIYENVCDLLSQITNCPSQLVKIGLDCHCPFKVVSIFVILLVIIIAVTYTCISKEGININVKTIYGDVSVAQLVTSMSGVVLGGVVMVVGSNLARGKIFTASIGSVGSLYPSVFIYCMNLHQYKCYIEQNSYIIQYGNIYSTYLSRKVNMNIY